MYGDPNDPLTQYMLLQGTTQGGSSGSPIAQNNTVDYDTDPSGNNYQRPSALTYVQQQLQRLRNKQAETAMSGRQYTNQTAANNWGLNVGAMNPRQRADFQAWQQGANANTPTAQSYASQMNQKNLAGAQWRGGVKSAAAGVASILGAIQAGQQSKAQAAANIMSQKRTSIAPGPQQFAYNRMLNQQEETLGQDNKDQDVAST